MDSRILHLDSGSEWRGGQRQLFLLALEQRARGMEPLVVGQPRSRLVMRLRRSGIASSGVRMLGRWDLTAVRRIRRLLRMWRPQIVHVHDMRSHALARKALVGLTDVALVVTCRTVPARIGRVWRLGPRVTRFIAPNLEVARFLASIGIPASAVDRVAPAIPRLLDVQPREWRRECRWDDDTMVCGIIGAKNGVNDAKLRAVMSHLSAEVRSGLRLVILGGVSAVESQLLDTPTFGAGFVDDISAAIAGFDIFANLSGSESMATAVLDAMALGVPPVTFDSGGAAEYIEHGRSGLAVASGDTVAFAAALSSLVQDEELRETLAAFGPGRAAGFSVARLAEGTQATYERVLGELTGNGASFLTA